MNAAIHSKQPTLPQALIFRVKTTALQSRRMAQNILSAGEISHASGDSVGDICIAESISPLWREGSAAELTLQAGKVHNLRIAARRLNGATIQAGKIFSFWAHVGRTTRCKGYVAGRELREGCLIPSVGGGICQLSNALYDAALKANFEIVERHAHSQVIPGSLAEIGRDATVFWNHVDLRFKSPSTFRIEAILTSTHLIVRLKADTVAPAKTQINVGRTVATINDCATCGVTSCFRNKPAATQSVSEAKTAYLLSEYWPEFDAFIHAQRRAHDVAAAPFFLKASRADWNLCGFSSVTRPLSNALRRAIALRFVRDGAERQRFLLDQSRLLAESFRAALAWDVRHVVVSLDLLPFLWRSGDLGGRTFDVLMTRHSLRHLHRCLDSARILHPESATLGEFRADEAAMHDEEEALRAAARVITPHAEVAAEFGSRSVRLAWELPAIQRRDVRGARIVFLGPTAGRRGAFEFREAIKDLGLNPIVIGSDLEGPDFWKGLAVEHRADNWLGDAAMVVAPAFVENQPRKLLNAVARGIPVIATRACGIDFDGQYVVEVPAGDPEALCRTISRLLPCQTSPSSQNK